MTCPLPLTGSLDTSSSWYPAYTSRPNVATQLAFVGRAPARCSYEITIDDPKIFLQPWSPEFEIVAKPEWDSVGLYECEEDNRLPGW
jgi:hypothetical protein